MHFTKTWKIKKIVLYEKDSNIHFKSKRKTLFNLKEYLKVKRNQLIVAVYKIYTSLFFSNIVIL